MMNTFIEKSAITLTLPGMHYAVRVFIMESARGRGAKLLGSLHAYNINSDGIREKCASQRNLRLL